MTVRDWFQIGRLHTSAAETGLMLIVAYLAHVPYVYWALYFVFGLLYHFVGFGYNSLFDYARYDRDDPNKSHHPMNRGVLTQHQVSQVLNAFLIIGIMFFFLLWIINLPRTHMQIYPLFVATLLFAVGIMFGFVYNLFSKDDKRNAGLTISMSYVCIALAIYLISGGTDVGSFSFVMIWIFCYIAFQIWIGGEAKDMGNLNEKNLLRDLHCTLTPDGGIVYSSGAAAFYVTLASGRFVSQFLIFDATSLFRIFVLTVTMVILTLYMVYLYRVRSHRRMLLILGIGEALTYVIFAIGIAPTVWLALLFILLPVGVFISLNKFMWNTWMSPLV